MHLIREDVESELEDYWIFKVAGQLLPHLNKIIVLFLSFLNLRTIFFNGSHLKIDISNQCY